MLPRLSDPAELRASWRQAMAALGQSVGVMRPSLLDGVDLTTVEEAARIALERGLVDDLDWLGPGAATVALYELTASLPPGRCRRELGRLVFARLYEGTATTFAAVATRLALGSVKSLDAATLRARVSLLFCLPIGTSVNADSLALTLVLRRLLCERWVERPSTGALPERRLAARLLEHAAREAVLRAQQGDLEPKQQLCGPELRPVFERLLFDREPLVWQHAAVARGLLASVDPALEQQLEVALDPGLSPTEWRRAAVSLVATLTNPTEQALRACCSVVEGPLSQADPGLPAAMVVGLPRVIEAEPDAAAGLLSVLCATERPDVAEAVASLLSEASDASFGRAAAEQAFRVLEGRARAGSVLRAVATRAMRMLSAEAGDEDSIRRAVRRALAAFENDGARPAYDAAADAVSEAHAAMEFIEAHDPLDDPGMPAVLGVLADLDGSVLEESRLFALLMLGRKPGDPDRHVAELDRLHERLGRFILDGETKAIRLRNAGPVLANQRRLRTLLHLVDLDARDDDGESLAQSPLIRRAMQVLLDRVARGPDPRIRRILCAALARSFDAAVRGGAVEPSDLLLVAADRLNDPLTLSSIAEASTNPDVRAPFAAYAAFVDPKPAGASEAPESLHGAMHAKSAAIRANEVSGRLRMLSHHLSVGASYRGEALRRLIFRLARALETVTLARGLSDVSDPSSGTDVPAELEEVCEGLQRLARGARRRVLDDHHGSADSTPDTASLAALIERALEEGTPLDATSLKRSAFELGFGLPTPLAGAIDDILSCLVGLPVVAASDVVATPLRRRRAPLPDWLLPHRTIGAFYVVRSLGTGGVSSVFVARRTEERHDANAESFALKVPDYDPTTARSLSEQEFLQLFREEAGALLSLPQQANLARFVTFDLASRPKPILVMELIPGAALDRLLRARSLTCERVFSYLDGVLSGLEAMHGVGVGHLDLKPSNVILRNGRTPVLVDFGLSGRQLRPGCGTLEYCAPEVLGVCPDGYAPVPMRADMYAFGCMAFELLFGELLFDAQDEMALVSLHVDHDGWPPRLAALGAVPEFSELAIVLAACLRRDPRRRPDATAMRAALADLKKTLETQPWPLSVRREARDLSA